MTWRGMPRAALRLGLCLLLACAGGAARAHPHVFILTKTALVFGKDARLVAIRQAWTFDDMYSSFVTAGLADGDTIATREQLAPLAKTNVEQLAAYHWFTTAKVAGTPVMFRPPTEYALEEGPDRLVTLRFTLPLTTPVGIKPGLSLQIYDPSYFIDFSGADKDSLSFVSAPAACSATIQKPGALGAGDKAKLTESFFTNQSPGADFGIKMAVKTIVTCP